MQSTLEIYMGDTNQLYLGVMGSQFAHWVHALESCLYTLRLNL